MLSNPSKKTTLSWWQGYVPQRPLELCLLVGQPQLDRSNGSATHRSDRGLGTGLKIQTETKKKKTVTKKINTTGQDGFSESSKDLV